MSMKNTGYMVNGFDVSRMSELDDDLRHAVERRSNLLGNAYKLFYTEPLKLVRGDGVYMYDDQGTRYLDAYNNVPSVGHCHPHVVEAVSRQAATLNTHTRYVSDQILDYAERLLATYPDEINNVMFTCTGSEAVDLALRIARYHTQATGIIVTENAYHGLTSEVAAISPSLGPNVPIGQKVWTVPAPSKNPAEGDNVGAVFAGHVERAIKDMERHGVRFAAFIADTLFSTDGIIGGPTGFLKPVVEVVHRAGGLYIADEVQPGFGRTGDAMWGFQRHDIVPDLAVMGKPMGNGIPIAGVAAKSEILDQFGKDIRYFNTFGGNTVSIAAAAATLDVIQNDGLLDNCKTVGAYMHKGLSDLCRPHDFISDVRGAGLYFSADLFDVDGNPDAELAQSVINGLRRHQVLIGGTGKDGNSLKIRPLLAYTQENADQFLEAMDSTLQEITGTST